ITRGLLAHVGNSVERRGGPRPSRRLRCAEPLGSQGFRACSPPDSRHSSGGRHHFPLMSRFVITILCKIVQEVTGWMIDLKKGVVVALQELYVLHALRPSLMGKSPTLSIDVSHGLIEHPSVSRFDLPITDARMLGDGRISVIGTDLHRQRTKS